MVTEPVKPLGSTLYLFSQLRLSSSVGDCYITKEDFLLAFKAVYNKAFIENNIYIGFKDARLVLLNLDIIILKLNI